MSNVEKLLEELMQHPESKGYIEACGKKDTPPEYAEAILSVARKLGIETQADTEEIVSFMENADAARKAATDQTIKDIVALDDDDVEGASGGLFSCGYSNLEDFKKLTEICWINDKCKRLIN